MPADAVIVGVGFTVIMTLTVSTQPNAFFPTTEYVVVVTGFALTLAPVVTFKPVPGIQVYVAAPLAVSDVELPEQMIAEEGVTVTVGRGYMVITCEAVPVQPPAPVPVTV